ncbi:DUF559 domain-containing protein [Jatrophihabitans sp.]|uniref:DUF559 domain-containing protein n=1 Tax=Jatrophihabitans sp. TaxID=1932789 RepID=UPI0030C6C46F|nr:G:T-mismatch repair endonuclease [Jatrophihabitans sp.]
MDWRDLARGQAGTVARGQLLRCGLTDDAVDGLVARELVTVLPGVYSPRAVPRSLAQREWAAVLWSGGVLSHWSAARRWGLPVPSRPQPHVTVGDRRFRGPVAGVRVHRVRLAPDDRTVLDGLALTTRTRTVIDLLRALRPPEARELRDRALAQHWIELADLQRSVSAQLGRTGNTQLRMLIGEHEAGADAESERVLHALLRRAGITGWRPQYCLLLPGRTLYLDVGFDAQRLAIEVDGRRYHDDLSDRFEADRARQNALIAAGWRVLRFTWRQLTEEPDLVIRTIVQLLAA